ncbi:hypothetical protein CLV91_0832 [Maribacter vaceletii]|uniref:DUF2064 domain-containing protein n=1 Tax=Maribacter vaceletii TaxID=1206816 RepID=A0A495EDX9_9FLAO|nr:DUF2064 domain-containing protein [Maribacter vaceletii]RKR14753.1 hypothetical protein CLV91_0832 [Maribacter vaceletii]
MKFKSSKQTAIVFFAQSSIEEVKHKKIANGISLFSALTKKTLDTIYKSKLPFFHFTEQEQVGNTFGERFTNAISSVYDLGYERVIAIGNDTPQLTKHHLLKAAQEISENKTVLGLSLDGGFYLMGFHKAQFNAHLFKNLSWQTNALKEQVFTWIKANKINVLKLNALKDIDTEKDVFTISSLYILRNSSFYILLLQFVQETKNIFYYIQNIVISSTKSVFYNKGSPFLQLQHPFFN